MSPFRLVLVNPNADAGHTRAMAQAAREVLDAGAEVLALTAEQGPATIEGHVDGARGAIEVARLVAAHPGADAYLVACFGDPGLHAARELTDAPVVGIGEAAYRAVTFVARRFAVVTTLPRGIAELEDAVAAAGLARACTAVLPLGVPVAEQGAEHPDTTEAIVATGRRAVEEHGAEAIVLACGAMAEVAGAVSARLGVPVLDGVGVGALLAHALWRAGLRTSKAGAYGWPPVPVLAPGDGAAW